MDSPAEVVRRYCSDLVSLTGSKGAPKRPESTTQQPNKKERQKHKQAQSREQTAISEEAGETRDAGLVDLNGEVDVDEENLAADTVQSSTADASTNEDPFARLPSDKLWKQEMLLRFALLEWMVQQEAEMPEEPMLIDKAMEDDTVKKRLKFSGWLTIGRHVSLQDWIERRIGEEVGVGLDEQDRPIVLPLKPLAELLPEAGRQRPFTSNESTLATPLPSIGDRSRGGGDQATTESGAPERSEKHE